VFNPWLAGIQAAQTIWDVNAVIGMRLMRIASGGVIAQREAERMIVEKFAANLESQMAVAMTMANGGGLVAASQSAAKIYRRKVRANKRRLRHR
jgi:hypothetical protein